MKISLWSLPRTGSTYVYQALNRFVWPNKPSDPILNEYFNEEKTDNNLEDFLLILKQQQDWVVKNQITHPVPNVIIDYLNKNNNYSFFLLRRSWFDMIASSCLAELTREWVNGLTSVYVGKSNYVSEQFFCERFNFFWNKLHENYKKIEKNKIIFYEDLSFWPRKDFFLLNLIQDINDCPPVKVSVKKQKDKKETILNYESLVGYYNSNFPIKTYESEFFYFNKNKELCMKND